MFLRAKITSLKCDSSDDVRLTLKMDDGTCPRLYLPSNNRLYRDFKSKDPIDLIGQDILVQCQDDKLQYVSPYGERISEASTKFFLNLTGEVDNGNSVEQIKFKIPLESFVTIIVSGLGGTSLQRDAIYTRLWAMADEKIELDRE